MQDMCIELLEHAFELSVKKEKKENEIGIKSIFIYTIRILNNNALLIYLTDIFKHHWQKTSHAKDIAQMKHLMFSKVLQSKMKIFLFCF